MYRIGVSASFSAAHRLGGYGGSCEELHGHNYRVEAVVETDDLDRAGLALDFRRLRKDLHDVLEDFDHRLLNNLDHFKALNPSSENIARLLFVALEKKLAGVKAVLVEVKVWETADAWASYCPSGDNNLE